MNDTTPDEQTATQRIKSTIAILADYLASAVVSRDLYERVYGNGQRAEGQASGYRTALFHLDAGTFDEIDAAAETAWRESLTQKIQSLIRASAESKDPAAALRLRRLADAGIEMLSEHDVAEFRAAS